MEFADDLLEACRDDWCFDAQSEGTRGRWLWALLVAAGLEEAVRPIVVERLEAPDAERAVWPFTQCSEIAAKLAKRGDRELRALLYRALERSHRGSTDRPVWGARFDPALLFEIDGVDGLVEAMRRLGGEAGSFDMDLVDEARELLGADLVDRRLACEGRRDSAVRAFLDAHSVEPGPTESPPPPTTWRHRSARELIEDLREAQSAPTAHPEFPRLAGAPHWGRHAGEPERRILAEALFEEPDPGVVVGILSAFQRTGLPSFDPRLVDHCRESSGASRTVGMRTLVRHPGPSARALAVEEVRAGTADAHTLALLAANFRRGDGPSIRGILEAHRDGEAEVAHDMAGAILSGLTKVPEDDVLRDGLRYIYDVNPCGHCRARAFAILMDRAWAPQWMLTETRHDSQEDIRNRARAARV